MTAQLANGGYKIYPKIVYDDSKPSVDEIKNKMKEFENKEEQNVSSLNKKRTNTFFKICSK